MILQSLFVIDEAGWSIEIQKCKASFFWAFLHIIHLFLLLPSPKWLHIKELDLWTALDHNNQRFEKEFFIFNDFLVTVCAMVCQFPDTQGAGQSHASPRLCWQQRFSCPIWGSYHRLWTNIQQLIQELVQGLRNMVYPHLFFPYRKIQTDFAEVYLDFTGFASLLNYIKYQIPLNLPSFFRHFFPSLPSPTSTILRTTSRRKS